MDKLTVDRYVERAVLPRDELDGGEVVREFEHQCLREVGRLRLVPALRAIRDLDLDGHRTGRAATSSRSSRCTSPFANAVVSSRIFCSSAWSFVRTSSGS